MFKIVEAYPLTDITVYMKIEAPDVARKAGPGQFVILRADETGERVPFTISDADPDAGTVSIIFQKVGLTTLKLGERKAGDTIADFVGPLGNVSDLDGYRSACVIGGGLGCAIALPQAKYLRGRGARVDMIAGFRNKDIIILEPQMKAVCDELTIMTDDGSNGNKGMVTDALKAKIAEGRKYDVVIAIGPPIMMKFVSLLTKEYGIKTIVSLNPIMIDGTGMCGGCRVTVGGERKFACVDGPDFDGHLVDFDELMKRNATYRDIEGECCNLYKAGQQRRSGPSKPAPSEGKEAAENA